MCICMYTHRCMFVCLYEQEFCHSILPQKRMAKAKNLKLKLSFLTSFQICHPKNPLSMVKTSSTLDSKSFDIPFPQFPDPPPSTPTTITTPCGFDRKSRPHTSMQQNKGKIHNSPVSSDSEGIVRPTAPSRTKKKTKETRFKRLDRENKQNSEKVKESFVVVKRSEDPYEDFKKSMLEMVMEKEMFEPNELEQLLMSFLSLNSRLHHKVIIEAFTEILKEVFCGQSK